MNVGIFDAHNHLHRFLHGIKEPKNPILTGWSKMVWSAIQKFELSSAYAVFDPIRGEAIAEGEYKGGRSATPDGILAEYQNVIDMSELMGVGVIQAESFAFSDPSSGDVLIPEADQLIGDLVMELQPLSDNIYIISSDKDLAQLVQMEKVTLVRPEGGGDYVKYLRDDVKEKWGVYPEQIPDYLTLVGDRVDNIQGTPSIGAKTAANLISIHGSIPQIIANAGGISLTEAKLVLKNNPASLQLSAVNGMTPRQTIELMKDMPNLLDRIGMVTILPGRFPVPTALPKPSYMDAASVMGKLGLGVAAVKLMEEGGGIWAR
jgi:DNA polymerase I